LQENHYVRLNFPNIIDDVRKIPTDQPLNFFLNMVNETFLDKKIFDRVALINDAIPHAPIGFYTNFNKLPKTFFKRIGQVKNLSLMNIYFNAANKQEYEETIRIDFDETVENIKQFIQGNKERHLPKGPILLFRIADQTDKDDRFVKDFQDVFHEFKFNKDYRSAMKRRSQWVGDESITGQISVPYLQLCLQWLNITVTCTDEVPHCCMDGAVEFPMGNLKD